MYFSEGKQRITEDKTPLPMQTAKIGVYSKTDFCMAYGVSMPTFEKWIADISRDIGWIKGQRQKFPPKVVKIIFDHLGEPA